MLVLINFLRSDINVGRNEDIIVTKKYGSQIDETEGSDVERFRYLRARSFCLELSVSSRVGIIARRNRTFSLCLVLLRDERRHRDKAEELAISR